MAAGDVETLASIAGMNVLVERFDEDAKRAGFNEQTFQTDVELKLQLAGIKVLTEEEWLAEPSLPVLCLVITPRHEKRGEFTYFHISLEFKQTVYLARNQKFTVASTWGIGSTGNGDLPHIRNVVKDDVDIFINAWLSVNP